MQQLSLGINPLHSYTISVNSYLKTNDKTVRRKINSSENQLEIKRKPILYTRDNCTHKSLCLGQTGITIKNAAKSLPRENVKYGGLLDRLTRGFKSG